MRIFIAMASFLLLSLGPFSAISGEGSPATTSVPPVTSGAATEGMSDAASDAAQKAAEEAAEEMKKKAKEEMDELK